MPVVIAGTINTYSKELVDVKLTSHFGVTYCQSSEPKKEVLITLGLGDIKRNDSLYGFNFAITYDRSKLYFNSKIVVNTLSEFADYSAVSFGLEPNKLFGAAINNIPMYGNKDLIGFYGEYVGELCNDSALIQLEYIEFTDEFQKEVNKLDTIWVKPTKAELNYTINPKFSEDVYKYDSTTTNFIPLEINATNVKYLDYIAFNVSAENASYELDFSNLNDNYEVSEIIKDQNSFDIVLKVLNISNITKNTNLLDLLIKRNIKETDTNSHIIVKPIKLSDCNCFDYTKVSSDSIKIDYIQNVSTSIDMNTDVYDTKFYYQDNVLSIDSKLLNIDTIQLFNSVGELLIDDNVNSNHYQNKINLVNGVYLGLIRSDKQLLKKKILVNN